MSDMSGSALGFGAGHDSGDEMAPGNENSESLEQMLEDDAVEAPPTVIPEGPGRDGITQPIIDTDDYPSEAVEVEPPAEGVEGEEEEPPPAGDAPQELLAGRYQDVGQLETGYKEIQSAFTTTIEANRQLQAAQAQQGQEVQELRQQNEQMIQMLQQIAFADDPEAGEAFQRELQQRQEIDARIAAGVQQAVGPYQEQAVQQQVAAQARSSVLEFYQREGIQEGDANDVAATEAFRQLRGVGLPLDITNPEHLQAAYRASQDQDFARALVNQPQALQIPGGVARLAQFVSGSIAPVAGAAPPNGTPAPAQRQAVRRRVEAHVETGSSGAPGGSAPGTKPADIDPFDEAMDYYKGQRSRGVLFGSQRT